MTHETHLPLRPPRDLEVIQARIALRIAARLSEQANQTPQDIGERLRFARELAVQHAQAARRLAPARETAQGLHMAGKGIAALSPRDGFSSWWLKLASFFPLVVLLGGLVVIQQIHDNSQISAAAEIDTALLADQLPPDAYRDPGFVEYLKISQD